MRLVPLISRAADPAAAGGYILPVWVAAAAVAALNALKRRPIAPEVALELLQPPGSRLIPVVAAALLAPGLALAETCCDPGEGLDLTRGLRVWVLARWLADSAGPWLELLAGEGVGVHAGSGELCLSGFGRELLECNLRPLLPPGRRLGLTVALPEGRRLAERTSNAAFGVVDGLALLGTQAEVQARASPDQLRCSLEELAERVAAPGFGGDLVLVIGANGLDLAPRLGLPAELLLKAGNWLGPLLVAAAEGGVRRLLLFGYQGKLLKLAGGIFHTHHHLADGRAEVLTALAALEGLAGSSLQRLHADARNTVEAALAGLDQREPRRAALLRQRIAAAVEQRSAAYLARHGAEAMAVGAVLFDRSRRVCARGPLGAAMLEDFGGPP
ncbi:MAG: cobalt-precorrin-5B (C(1))-methyltransferase CbiD [Synechococcaceae cyanobacterium]|nr:cobalt-precorrin-5B (C(1))-methyltransferase CbiD [Synechococcaceae cyanobacterium]